MSLVRATEFWSAGFDVAVEVPPMVVRGVGAGVVLALVVHHIMHAVGGAVDA